MHRIDIFRRNNKAVLVLGLLLALLVTIYVLATQQKDAAAETVYQTETAKRGALSATVGATGSVRANQSATLRWETSGVVEAVNAQMGSTVSADTILAELKQDSLPQGIILAQADLLSAQQALDDLIGSADTARANAAIAVRDAQAAYEDTVRYRELLDQRVTYDVLVGFNGMSTPMGWVKIPDIRHIKYNPDETQKAEADQDVALYKAELEDAQRAYERLQNGPDPKDLAAARARVDAAQAALNQAKISAPFDGVITDINVLQGDQVSAGESAFRVEDLSRLLIDLEVSEVDINSVSPGQEVTVNFDAVQNKDYHGRVVEIAGAGSATAGVISFRVTVELTDADDLIKPGMTAAVVIQVRYVQNALLVPNRAVRVLDGKRFIYRLLPDSSLDSVEVRLGATADIYSEVVGGDLQAGDLIVLDPPATLNADF